MNYRERFLAALALEKVNRTPVAVPTNTGTVDLMRASDAFWPEAQMDAKKMAELALAAHRVAGIESVTVPFDKFVECEAYGSRLDGWSQDKQPVAERIIDRPEDVKKLRTPSPKKDGRMPAVIEAVKLLRKEVGDELPIIATIASPFEIASTIWNPNALVLYLEYDKEPLKHLLEMNARLAIDYGRQLVNAGADAISIIDGNSQNLFGVPMIIDYNFDGVEPGAENYEEFSGLYIKKIAKALKAPAILHVCGDTRVVLDHMAETEVSGLSIDRVSVKEAKKIVKNEAAIIGNVQVETLLKAQPKEIIKEAKRALKQGVDILAPGCNLIPGTPLGSIKVFARAALRH